MLRRILIENDFAVTGAALQSHVLIARGQPDSARREDITVLGFVNSQRALVVEPLCYELGKKRGHVLYDSDRDRETGR